MLTYFGIYCKKKSSSDELPFFEETHTLFLCFKYTLFFCNYYTVVTFDLKNVIIVLIGKGILHKKGLYFL